MQIRYEQSTDFVGGIRTRYTAFSSRLNMKHPPTSSVGFATFLCKDLGDSSHLYPATIIKIVARNL